MTTHVKIVANLLAKPGKERELEELLATMTTPSRDEPGNLRYDIWQDQADRTRFVLDELYADSDALAKHRASPHFQAYLAKIGDIAERSALVLDPLSIG